MTEDTRVNRHPRFPDFEPDEWLGRTIARRYLLVEFLGHGSSSSVFRTEDRLSGESAALKLLHGLTPDEREIFRREIAHLRLLRLPGVVRMRDEGSEDGTPFIVMDLVDGAPFPGDFGGDWSRMETTVLSLLEALDRVHWAGVVHRDIKPDNVLVGADGLPIVLDLGASAHRVAGGEWSRRIMGTPLYLSPEQLRGETATFRSDLYAVGVMLYQSLAGVPPHRGETFPDLVTARLGSRHLPLKNRAPDVPEAVAEVVDDLLALDPSARPETASEVIARLRRSAPQETSSVWLGSTEPVDRLFRAAREGKGADLAGPVGSGRTRCLLEVSTRLTAAGTEVVWLVPGSTPFDSLVPLIGEPAELVAADLEEARLAVGKEVEAALSRGVVVIADDLEELDSWTRWGLEAWRDRGAVLRAVADDREGIRIPPIPEEELRNLFVGPDRLFHLREDAATELERRTGGLAGNVAEEIRAWQRAGLARREGNRLVVSRSALDRLRSGLRVVRPPTPTRRSRPELPAEFELPLAVIDLAGTSADVPLLASAIRRPPWRVEAEVQELVRRGAVRVLAGGRLQAAIPARPVEDSPAALHRALADGLAPGARERLRHLVAAGATEEIAEEALAAADGRVGEGRLGEAWAAVLEGVRALRAEERSDGEIPLLRRLLRLALQRGTIDEALYFIESAVSYTGEVEALEAIGRAALLAVRGDGERSLDLLEGMEFPDEPEMHHLLLSVRTVAGRYTAVEREAEVVAESALWAEAQEDATIRSIAREWRGWLAYRTGHYEEAAHFQEEAGRIAPDPIRRASACLNAASAWMEALEFERAEEPAREAKALAASCRHALSEARAEQLLRALAYRQGREGEPDRELVKACRGVEMPNLQGMILLTEAAAAWRSGLLDSAASLAGEAAERFGGIGRTPGRILAVALAAACGAEPAGSWEDLVEQAGDCRIPCIGMQTAALLALARPELAGVCRRIVEERSEDLTGQEVRREVISPAEALTYTKGDVA